MPDMDTTDDGWCGGHEVYMPEGRPTQLLGPDGEPLKYLIRYKAGFDLRPRHERQKKQD